MERAGIDDQIAYLSKVPETQLAAVRAILAVAALPASRVTNSSNPICANYDLPTLPCTQIVPRISGNPDENIKALAEQVVGAFKRQLSTIRFEPSSKITYESIGQQKIQIRYF